jgi:3D (Asp-Asp-Asp) domain-containing protein
MISGSFWRKSVVTAVAVGGFVSLYEVRPLDSKDATRQMSPPEAAPVAPGTRLAFNATAYCKGMTTSSGVPAQSGVAASDPSLLPVGSVVDIDAGDARYSGIYTVMDTGPAVQGRLIDLYMWNCNEALHFGRRAIHVKVLRLGWNPHATTPTFLGRLFKKREPPALPSRPLPQVVQPPGGGPYS